MSGLVAIFGWHALLTPELLVVAARRGMSPKSGDGKNRGG